MPTDKPTKPPLLDLDVILESLATVKMDGVLYALKQWGALGLRDRNRLSKISARMAEIEGLDEPTDADSAEHDELTIETMLIIGNQAADVVRAANAEKRRNAVETFFALRLTSQSERFRQIVSAVAPPAELTATIPTTAKRPTSANGSRDSNRATRRATRKRG